MDKTSDHSQNSDARTNRLLAILEAKDHDALMQVAKVVSLKFHKTLYRQDGPIDAVYFPLQAMISLLVTTDGQPQMEMATIGREGVVGASEIFQKQGAMGLHIVQIPGSAVRIDALALKTLAAGRPAINELIAKHLLALTRQILYGAACNRLHSMEERCARWLLMTHDSAGQDTFPITQEFLSHMLGVRRATVNVATGMLKKAGLIRYVRGKLTIIDRPGLESAACECYQSIVMAYTALLPSPLETTLR